ncbi:MAG: class I tRNA ligase family protein [bacterium]|nr:class I tRNA ligase family protein [bacterium]
MAPNKENKKSNAVSREEQVLNFWKENKIFNKTLEKKSPKGEFVFYEGPPTANTKPALHHLEARAFKDAIPRYKTMQGYHVRRKAGWDTHGLPVELQVEKKLGLNSKKAIEEYGIAKFNQECRENVWEQIDLWNKFTERIGFWLDQENPYVTYKNDYIESVWNVIKQADEQKLLYKDYKVVPWCPRCETALSSHELAQGYEDVKDLSITAKFPFRTDDSPSEPTSNGTDKIKKYFLAWTTTPWTLPGNIALAVGEEIDYVEIKVKGEILVLAKARLALITDTYEIVATHKGKEMVGMQYEPLFPYLKTLLEQEGESTEKAFRIYSANFVNTQDGTGIVHTAVMYGQDDFELGTKVGLPKYHLVNPDGKFIKGTGFLEGRFVREEKDGKPTMAIDIIKNLQDRNLFFSKENYLHSYPHCWRCHTALVYYARDSWYIRMSDKKIKKKLISENKKINWEPAHTRDGRFGEWLKDIKDWAISRERYWGTPLPVWECTRCDKRKVIRSLEDLKKNSKKSSNQYLVMRHGEAEHNAKNIYSSNQTKNHLTAKGHEQVLETTKSLRNKKINKIFCSPFLRTKETAELVAEEIGFPKSEIIYDARIRELEFGDFSERPVSEYWDYAKDKILDFDTKIPGGESYQDAKNRIGEFLYEIDKKFTNETILIISHGLAVELFPGLIEGADKKRSLGIFHSQLKNRPAVLHREHEFTQLPHNTDYELDYHRPYIDEVKLVCGCDNDMLRSKEVMDVWFDSGAMPFAQDHYPFENKNWVEGKGYPADYISEAIDQTRGWFYTLHAVGILMGKGRAYKNVICLGHLLDANGKKMSKSLGNIVDPWEMIEKYGVDTLRLWMYSVNQPGESKNFDEKTVQLLNQQVFGLLYNVLAFYELFRDKKLEHDEEKIEPDNILDQWILVRLILLVSECTEKLDDYKLLEPVRAVRDFINDLSTWYLRRSRDVIKDGDSSSKQTLYFVLKTLAKVMAPFAPFAAENIWLKLKTKEDVESVHLAKWPSMSSMGRYDVIEFMQRTRDIVSLGLEARQQAKIQVRQPLARLKVRNLKLKHEYLELIKDELNVKEIVVDESLEKEVELNTKITPDLKDEGNYRELARALQDMRKKQGLTPSDVVTLFFGTNKESKEFIHKFESDLKKAVLISEIEFNKNDGEEIKVGDLVFRVKMVK